MTDEGCTGNGRGTGQAHTCDSCTPEIPQVARGAARDALLAHMRDWREDGSVTCKACGLSDDQPYGWLQHQADVALAAALPHLLTEVKSMCETATKVGYALGRKEALEEAEAAIDAKEVWFREMHRPYTADGCSNAALIVRGMRLQAQEATSNGLTASSRHPGTPEATKPPQEGHPRVCSCRTIALSGWDRVQQAVDPKCILHGAPDLPEESDQ